MQTHHTQTPESPAPEREFAMTFTATSRGARLARRLVAQCLETWGHPYDGVVNETLTLIAAELSANAVQHGRVPGRDFHLRLSVADGAGDRPGQDKRLRLAVSDTRAERLPAPAQPDPTAESGRGLLIVAALADDWGTQPRVPGPGKTVWAELAP
ncbi:ATP-binding protein [Streptomyces sp. NBC_00006]|uniref:ATP-binding protein n=1 Tax=Streptomyces sp. NBC_00006 TaxID=2975619 RepID=UPI002255F22A|nr:ATP-binding protein [Streptomyces sp. NBC_00006]MCX5529778.1 ATP-binding protein [Streptomyces sp. NBC_00006]